MLFDTINEGFFRPLSLGNFRLNGECLLAIYKRFYSRHHPSPKRDDFLDTIKAQIEAHPELGIENEALLCEGPDGQLDPTDISGRARRVYNTLMSAGWIEETTRGLKTTAELSQMAQFFMETLAKIDAGFMLEIAGNIATLKVVLNQLATGNDDAVIAIKACTDQLRAFERSLRATFTRLGNIRKEVIKQKTSRDRINYLMNSFVEGVMMSSYKRMMQDENPARLRAATKGLILDFRSDDVLLNKLGIAFTKAYFKEELESADTATMVEALEKGSRLFDDCLVEIEEILDDIERTSEAIKKGVSQLEMQLTSQAFYQHRLRAGDEMRIDSSIKKFASFIAGFDGSLHVEDVPSNIIDRPYYFSENALTEPRKAKKKIAAATVQINDIDPVTIARNRLGDVYLSRTNPSDDVLIAFVRQRMAQTDVLEFSDEMMNDIDDYFLCSKLIGAALMDELPGDLDTEFEVNFSNDIIVQTRYVSAPAFTITRKQPNGVVTRAA